jgi:hypothetical protein
MPTREARNVADERTWLGRLLTLVEAAPPVESVAILERVLEEQIAAGRSVVSHHGSRRQSPRKTDPRG